MSRAEPFFRLVAISVAASLLFGGCTSDEPETRSPAPTAVSPSSTGTSTPTPIVSPIPPTTTSPEARRTGDPALDAIIAAVETRDVAALAALVEYQEIGCTFADGLGGPPKCPKHAQEGEEFSVFPYSACEGGWSHTATQELGTFAHNSEGLWAVLQVNAYPDTDLWPAADTFLVFHSQAGSTPVASYLEVTDGRITRSSMVCAGGLDELLAVEIYDLEVLAGPWEGPESMPIARPVTGVEGVDSVLESTAHYDLGPLIEAAQRGMQVLPDVPCVATIMESGEIDCHTEKGEEPGALVNVFPAAYCHGTVMRDPLPTLRAVLDGAPVLHSVLHAPEEPSPSEVYQYGDYWLVYEMTSRTYPYDAVRLHVSEPGELLLVWFGCGPTLRGLVEWDGAPLPRLEVTYVEQP